MRDNSRGKVGGFPNSIIEKEKERVNSEVKVFQILR
jgi:hypothetical protein